MTNFYRLLLLTVIFVITAGTFCFSQLDSSIPKVSATEITKSTKEDTSQSLIVIGDINITGYKKTKPYIIQREIPFKQGESVLRSELPAKLTLARQQLMNTSLFVDVDVSVASHHNDIVFVNVLVKERWYLFPLPYFKIIDRNVNEWWVQNKRSLQRVNYGLKFMQNNVSGRNDHLNFWLISGYTKQASIRYESPFLDNKLKHGMNVGMSYSSNRELNYVTDSNKQKFLKDPDQFLVSLFAVDVSYSYRPAIKTRHNFRISYSDLKVKDTVLARNPNYFPEGLKNVRIPDINYTIQYFNVDYQPYPLKGFLGEAYIYQRFGKKITGFQLGGSGSYSFKMFPKTFMEFQGSGLAKLPSRLPYFSNRLLGSSNLFMRGLEYYVVEGSAGGIARATAKREVLSVKVPNPIGTKTHDKIPVRIFLKAYGDAGYAYLKEQNNFYVDVVNNVSVTKGIYRFLNNKPLYTWGAGVDIISFYDLVLKLEYSYNQFGQSGLFIHTRSDF